MVNYREDRAQATALVTGRILSMALARSPAKRSYPVRAIASWRATRRGLPSKRHLPVAIHGGMLPQRCNGIAHALLDPPALSETLRDLPDPCTAVDFHAKVLVHGL
jgi:hypothetical protein